MLTMRPPALDSLRPFADISVRSTKSVGFSRRLEWSAAPRISLTIRR